ncbi:MAG TPA: decarboxylating 6-phosphogluconate dehydrogenase [Candidatus Saccharimonadales bacterium]|nr:decarboxylating 6-phosphogluconate dehydrogenase [Candidatus Saccharimonadales bacterium]
MKLAVAGLGRMGMQIARKLAENGHEVIAHNRSHGPIEQAVAYGATGAYTKEDVVKAFDGQPVTVWVMIPAEVVDSELDAWLHVLPKNSTIIDGGNSDFRLTRERAKKVAAAGMVLLDSGTSGGVWGYQRGFSMMVGGDKTAFEATEPVFKTLAAPGGGYQHFGEPGSGHYVKMVHNAVEYGMMESLAEGYRMLKEGPYKELDLAAAGAVWQKNSVITSWLNDLCQQAIAENPSLSGIDGYVAESGEARWTLETAKDIGIPLPAIQTSFDVRLASQKGETTFTTKMLAAMRNKFGGHALNKS